MSYNTSVADEYLYGPGGPPPQDPTQSVGHDVGYNVEVANEYAGLPRDTAPPEADPTQSVGYDTDTTKRRQTIDFSQSVGQEVPQPSAPAPAPVETAPLPTFEPLPGFTVAANAGPVDHTQDVGAPYEGPPIPAGYDAAAGEVLPAFGPALPPGYTEDYGKQETRHPGIFGAVRDFGKAAFVSPVISSAYESITGGEQNPFAITGKAQEDLARALVVGSLEGQNYLTDYGKRAAGAQLSMDLTKAPEGEDPSFWDNAQQYLHNQTLGSLEYLPYVLTGQPLGTISQQQADVATVIGENPYSTFIPATKAATGPAGVTAEDIPIIGGPLSHLPGVGDRDLYNVAGLGGALRAGYSAVSGVPRAFQGEAPAIDVNALEDDIAGGLSLNAALQKYQGDEGLKIAAIYGNPMTWIGPPGGGKVAEAIHTAGYGMTPSAIGRIVRAAESTGFAKFDERAVPAIAGKLVFDEGTHGALDALVAQSTRGPDTVLQAWKDLGRELVGVPSNRVPDQINRVMDATVGVLASDWAKAGGAAKLPFRDFLADALIPTLPEVDARLVAAGINPVVAGAAEGMTRRMVAENIASKAMEGLALKQVSTKSAGLLQGALQYARTGQINTSSRLFNDLNAIRTGVAGTVKSGILATDPRYYLQNLVDNVLHAVLGGGYAPVTGKYGEAVMDNVDRLKGTTGMPRAMLDKYGITVDVGQTFAKDVGAMSAKGPVPSKGFLGTTAQLAAAPGKLTGGLVEKVGNPFENFPRQSLWSRTAANSIQIGYSNLDNALTFELGQLGHNPEVARLMTGFKDGLVSGETSSFESASKWLADQTTADPTARTWLVNARQYLPEYVNQVNQAASTEAFRKVMQVFNNYENHIKYLDTLAQMVFLFSKYQTRAPGWVASQGIEHPNLFLQSFQGAKQLRDWNDINRPGARKSTDERYFIPGSRVGVDPFDIVPWNRALGTFTYGGSQPDTATDLNQSAVARGIRGFLGTNLIGQPALPAQLLGEGTGVLPPPSQNVTDQPSISVAAGLTGERQIGGRPVNLGRLGATILSPQGFIEEKTNELLGRPVDTGYIDYWTRSFMQQMEINNPALDSDEMKSQLRAKSGPQYDQAHQLAVDHLQQQRNLAQWSPFSISLEAPGEAQTAVLRQQHSDAIQLAKNEMDAAGKNYNDAVYRGDPYQTLLAERRYVDATQHYKDTLGSNPLPSVNITGGSQFEGQFFPGRAPEDPAYRIISKALDDQGKATKYNVPDSASPYSTVRANQYVLQTAEGENPAQDYLRKHGYPDIVLPNPVNPYSLGAVALKDVVREAEQGFNYRDPRTGEVRHIPGDYPIADALANKPGVTDAEARQILQSFESNATYHDTQYGRGLDQASRLRLLDAEAQKYAAGNQIITGIEGTPTTVLQDLGKPGGYYATLDKAYAAPEETRQRWFDEANRILAQTPGGKAYVDLARTLSQNVGGLELWQQESLRGAAQRGLLTGLDYNPLKDDAALADKRFLWRVADEPTRHALIDFDNLKTAWDQGHPGFRGLQDQYYAQPDAEAKKAFLTAHPELTRGWDEIEALKLRVQKDDGVHPDFANLRRDNAILAGQIPGAVARDQTSASVKADRLYFEQWNQKQRQTYDAYQEFNQSKTAQDYFNQLDQAPKKGDPGYNEWWHANGNRYFAIRDAYNAGLDGIAARTGYKPRDIANEMKVAKGIPITDTTTTTTGTTGGGGASYGTGTRSSGGGRGGGSSRGGSGAVGAAIEGRNRFYDTFDTLTSREKAALHDVRGLDKALAKGARLSADEWADAHSAMEKALPGIRDTQSTRDAYFDLLDTLTSREKVMMRDLTARIAGHDQTGESIRAAMAELRDRLRTGGTGAQTQGGGSGLAARRNPTAADIERYGSSYYANQAIERARSGGAGQASGGSEYDAGARYANTIRTRQPTTSYSSNTRRTTTKKPAA